MFNPTRDQVREFFCESWRKYNERLPLVGAEVTAADLIAKHPEYHALLATPQEATSRDWAPEGGQMNPFLHLSLHLAIHEQISIDQPNGVRNAFMAIAQKLDQHAAEHILIEVLGEIIWRAQREGSEMDAIAYVERIKQIASTHQ